MKILHSSIFYIHHRSFFKILYTNSIKNFNLRRLVATIVFVIIYFIVILVNILFRLLDEILFYGYRNTKIEQPIFIISNPRSGTTLLHRLMCLDEKSYVYMLLFHTIIISISFYKCIDILSSLDRRIYSPLAKLIRWIEKKMFSGWEGIHEVGFNRTEEDEGLWFFNFTSPALNLISPFYGDFSYLSVLDDFPEKERKSLMLFYKNCLQRMHYAFGKNKTFLIKSVMASGRIQSYLEFFPDARIIFILRDPVKTVPSYISMFSRSWKLHSPDVLKKIDIYKANGLAPIDFYKHFHKIRNRIPKENMVTLYYSNLIKSPLQQIQEIYSHFYLKFTSEYEKKIKEELSKSREYTSRHKYSLEQYGYTKEELKEILKEIYSTYTFISDG